MKQFRVLLAALAVSLPAGFGHADDHSGFNGVWHLAAKQNALVTSTGTAPPLIVAKGTTDDTDRCLPNGIPRLFLRGTPFRITVGSTMVGEFFETDHAFRLIYLDTPHYDAIAPAYLGQAVGKWDGDTLDIDVNQFNEVTWLDNTGLPHSDKLHLTERLSLDRAGKLHDLITIADPTDYKAPWQTELTFTRSAQTTLAEHYCLKEKRLL